MTNDVAPLLLSFILSLVLTPLFGACARRLGWVAKPKSDRWHTRPTALMGGGAFFIAVLISYFFAARSFPNANVLLLGSTWLFVVGLIDDLVRIRPYQKLVGQVLGAAWIISQGMALHWMDLPWLNVGLTFFWVVGITNAFNLLDNMDGLAAGIAGIASLFFAGRFAWHGQLDQALFYGILAMALLAFLVYNFNPASIFMGDSGAMFIGFTLASAALLPISQSDADGNFVRIAAPILMMSVPIFDTTLVTVCRIRNGRAVSQGGRDHSSHRLVALGLSERQAVLVLYSIAMISGLLSLFLDQIAFGLSAFLLAAYGLLLVGFGWFLGRVAVYASKTGN
jgi:UDP-GlcNAc:undecaprenyl-phosphate GlcNAc-1-phosphate transferase